MSLEQKLFATREPLFLKKTRGKVKVHKTVPAFLQESALVAHPGFISLHGDSKTLRLITHPEEKFFLPKQAYSNNSHLGFLYKKRLLAYWSGARSCLVEDTESGRLFRLKGMSFNESKPYLEISPQRVYGGQFLQSARYEISFTNKFNRLFAREGIQPVMHYRGMYIYPYLVDEHNNKIAAEIFEVLGDTRLDELTCHLVNELAKVKNKSELVEPFRQLYYSFGWATGRLKKLMDKSNITWGDRPENTNAHYGNIVIYPADAQHLALGLVDFDASCDRSEFSREGLRHQQKCEYEQLAKAQFSSGQVISSRSPRVLYYDPYLFFNLNVWSLFHRGFREAYDKSLRSQVSNLIDREPFELMLQMIRKAQNEEK